MSSMWDQTEELVKRQDQANGIWLKLANDGDKAVVVFLGEPYPREVCFLEGKYVPADEAARAKGAKASLRVALNVAIYPSKEGKVIEQGAMFFKDLVRVRAKYGLEKWAFEIERHGAAKDPKTTYSILPEHKLSDDEQRAFAALPLQDLEKVYAAEDSGEAGEPIGSYDARAADAPIDAAAVQPLVEALRAMPRAAVDKFLQHFGVQRIKDLPTSAATKAAAFVEQLRRELAPPQDVDPFA